MKFTDLELIPSVIINDIDPKKLGRVRCTVPGYINGETMAVSRMPWIMPLNMNGYQQFSHPMKGQKVWVIKNHTNENEYWYIPFFELNEDSKSYLSQVYDQDHPEILFSRNSGGYHALMTYDDKNGYIVNINEKVIKIKPNGEILIKSNNAEVNIKNNKIYIGDGEGSFEPAVKGNTLKDILTNLSSAMKILCKAATGCPYTEVLSNGFKEAEKAINDSECSKFISENTNLN